MANLRRPLIIILSLLALAAAGCNMPARTPGTTTTPVITVLPAVTIIPKDPNDTPAPALTLTSPALTPASSAVVTGTPQVTATAGLTPSSQPLNRKDPNAVIAGVRAALQQKDPTFFAQFAAQDLNYIDYIEGGQPVERAKLLGDLSTRLAASSPQCAQYGTYEQTLQVWTSGWSPLWQIDQICYQGCNPLNPPHTSQNAAFFFSPNSSGEYELNAVWLNNDDLWRSIYRVEMHTCGEPYQPLPTPLPVVSATAFACPGAPASRLKTGDRAYASDQTTIPSRVRSAPGTGTEILGLLQPRQVVNILAGPQCAQGYVWWQVRLLGGSLTGWTAEGQGSSYWLEPCTVAKCGQP